MEINDSYKTIAGPSSEVLFKDRNSKFFGYAFPVTDEYTVKGILEELRKKHHAARHWCYAWQFGTEVIQYRANDDGEPGNSAGMPIYGQIQSFGVTNVLVVVVRYFGGTKLGVGGLINAYKTAAMLALEASEIVNKTVDLQFRILFGYPLMNPVMRLIREFDLDIKEQIMELDCIFTISVRKSQYEEAVKAFENIYGLTIKTNF